MAINVALEMDKLKIAITKLSMLAERQLNYLMNPKLNEILPPFVNPREIRVESRHAGSSVHRGFHSG